MELKQYVKPSFFNMKKGELINDAIAKLPVAKDEKLTDESGNEVANFKGIKVTTENGASAIVNCPSKRYTIVQHAEAFRPIIEGLTQAGYKDFKFILYSDYKRSELQIYTQDPLYDGVQLGFSVKNSFDGSLALTYGIKGHKQSHQIELVGYRQVCSNGMKVKVPLDEAEIITPELKVKLQTFFNERTRILHTESAKAKIEAIQYVVEALALLREPVEALIKKSQKFTLKDEQILKDLIKFHVGNRYARKVREQFFEESQDLWGLYNAVTYVASHDPKMRLVTRENLIDKASNLLTVAVNGLPKAEVEE